jgi:transglutaminase-like putative cysteine protease
VLRSESLIPGVETRRWKPGDEERPLYAVDLGAWGALMTSGEIRAPEHVRRLRLALRGLPPGLGMPGELDLRRAAFPEGRARPAAAGPDVQPAPFIESDAPEVAALAREIVAPGAGPAEAARRVAAWIQANLRQGDAVGPPSALATLRTRRGNCNEIAALATALLRASGFPARVAFGIAYHRGAFRYHAWPEVRHGDAWVPFDPTFGQIPADATHVRLAAGGVDAQAAVLHAAGRLTVEILEVEEEPR